MFYKKASRRFMKSFIDKGFFNRPSEMDYPSMQCALIDAELSGPASHGVCLPVVSNKTVRSSVVSLHHSVSPSAVAFAVPKVIVDPIKGFGFGRVAHIEQKRVKRVKPSFAHSNSTPPIPSPVFVGFVGASFDHAVPDAKSLCMFGVRPSVAVRRTSPNKRFRNCAATRDGSFFLSEVSSNDKRRVTAVAFALPQALPIPTSSGRNNKKFSVPFPDEINTLVHLTSPSST